MGKAVVSPVVKKFSQKADKKHFEALWQQYGNKKVLPKGYELQALRALSFYPELLRERIVFRFKDQNIAHSSAPSFLSLLNPFRQRKYFITISQILPIDLEPTLFSHLSYNAQIGVLAHELAHTSEYVRKSSLWIVVLGIKYVLGVFKSYKHHFEQETDKRAINHGAGYQLREWSKAVHEYHIRDGRGENYLSEQQITAILKVHPLYR
jgi:hypothetical protein